MEIQRCPECGGRVKTNYCDICLKKVPFKGVPVKQTWRHVEGSSAHRMEKGHECVSFDQKKKSIKTTFTKPDRKTAAKNKKGASVAAIILAVLSLLPVLFGFVEEAIDSVPAPEPEYMSEEVFTQGGDIPGIMPVELYNDGAIIVTADYADLYYDDYTVFMTVINESTSDIIVGTDLLSVNGYMHASSLYAEVDAGETVQESLQLYSWELEQANIEEVAELSFCLIIYDQSDYADIARSELITIETDIAGTYEQPEFLDGWELYKDEHVTVRLVSTGVQYGECGLQLYVENLSDQMISVSVPKAWINGTEASGSLWSTLRPGTRAVNQTYLYDVYDKDGQELVDLDQIEEITLELHIEYMEDWYIEETITEAITFNPNELPNVF